MAHEMLPNACLHVNFHARPWLRNREERSEVRRSYTGRCVEDFVGAGEGNRNHHGSKLLKKLRSRKRVPTSNVSCDSLKRADMLLDQPRDKKRN
jgi:hypothetical protein